MLHHMLAGPSSPASDSSTNIKLRAQDDTSAGDNMTFLKSQLTWDMGDDGKERVMDADGNGWVQVVGGCRSRGLRMVCVC
jgi:protein arginine N-methyltransferase 2